MVKMNRVRAGNVAKARFVYVITRGPYVKIGISSHPKRRATALRLSSPDPLDIAFVLKPTNGKTARDVEVEAHRLLKPWHSRGEWFRCGQDLAQLAVQQADAPAANVDDFLQMLAAHDKLSRADPEASYAAWGAMKQKHPELLYRAGGAL